MPKSSSRADKIQAVEDAILPLSEGSPYVNVLVYGRNGRGKTRFAASGPNVLIVDVNEEGTSSARNMKGHVYHVRKWEDITYLYWYLKQGNHPYETVVIDTLTQLQKMCMSHVLKRAEDRDPNRPPKTPAQRDWNTMTEEMAPKIYDFRNLPMHTVFLCQLRVNKKVDEDGNSSETGETTYVPNLSPAVRAAALDAVGITGFIFKKEFEKKTVVKVKGKRETKTKSVWKSVLLTGDHDDYESKDRTGRLPRMIVEPKMSQIIEANLTGVENGDSQEEED